MKNHCVGNPDFEGKNGLSDRSGPCVSEGLLSVCMCGERLGSNNFIA